MNIETALDSSATLNLILEVDIDDFKNKFPMVTVEDHTIIAVDYSEKDFDDIFLGLAPYLEHDQELPFYIPRQDDGVIHYHNGQAVIKYKTTQHSEGHVRLNTADLDTIERHDPETLAQIYRDLCEREIANLKMKGNKALFDKICSHPQATSGLDFNRILK